MASRDVRRALDELSIRELVSRIMDPERTRPVVVITTGRRVHGDQLNPDRIAAAVGDEVEVAVVPTGRLTYILSDELPSASDVFGDAARTYPVGTAWHSRPERASARFARVDTNMHRLEQQVIADARSAARAAAAAMSGHIPQGVSKVTTAPRARSLAATRFSGITPAAMPGAPRLPARPTASVPTEPSPARPFGALRPSLAATAPPAQTHPAQTHPAQTHPAQTNPAGRTAPPPPKVSSIPEDKPVPAQGTSRDLWHAQSEAEGRALALQLLSHERRRPVLVISTPREGAGPLLDAAGLAERVNKVADVVVLHTGPASWALAEEVPHLTQVYGGAGRVYPAHRGWHTDPYQAALRFCWPKDDPSRVADALEDDVYAAAAEAGSLTPARPGSAVGRPAAGKVTGFLDRHNAVLRLDSGSQAFVGADLLVPGIGPERLLRQGMRLHGRVILEGAFGRFLPDPIADDPSARLAQAYVVGDLVLARMTQVTAEFASGLLHPHVQVAITAEEDVDLRNFIAVDDVVTLELTQTQPWSAVLAHSEAPSVETPSVLPGGPAWLTEADLPAPVLEPEPDPDPGLDGEPEPSQEPAAAQVDPSLTHSPDTAVLIRRLLAVQAERDDLATRLQRSERAGEKHRRSAGTAREEAKKLRNQLRSQKDQADAYRARVEGADLFDEPAEQLRHDVRMAWLRRTPPSDRADLPLRRWTVGPEFLSTLESLEGISRDKVLEVLVDVITGRVKDVPGRDLHQLRTGRTGAPLTRGKARAWRCALQIHSPSARRLHFWTLPDNSVELDRVGVHDDGIQP